MLFSIVAFSWKGKNMGKDLKGKDIGKGYSQRKDGYYIARIQCDGQVAVCELDKNLTKLKKTVREKMEEYEINSGRSNMTVTEWFEEWFDTYKVPLVKPQSVSPMKRKVYSTFLPYIGGLKLREIRSIDLQRAINSLLDEDKYARSSISEALGRLRDCFASAVNNRMMTTNPAFDLIVPFNEEHDKERRWLSLYEIEVFLNAVKGDWWEEMLYVAIYTGMRVGELGGLRWDDIDWKGKYINIRQNLISSYSNGVKTLKVSTLKTKNSYRKIPFMKDVEAMLRSQKKKVEDSKKRMGTRWRNDESIYGDLVFVSSMGSPMMRYNAQKAINAVVYNINLEEAHKAKAERREPKVFDHVYPHALRHTFASLCYAAEMQPKTVQVLMGHANYSTTIDIYTHIGETFQKEEIDKFNNLTLNNKATETVHRTIDKKGA